MEFTNEVLHKMQDKQKFNRQFQKWYYGMSEELKEVEPVRSDRIFNRGERIGSCLDYWFWDVYHQNKLMDLQKVNRCKNNRFCPNCRKFDLSKFIHNYGYTFKNLLLQGYNPYLLTLTVPNVKGQELRNTIDKMNDSFNRFFKLFNQPIGQGMKGFKGRLIKFDGALKVLEITYNEKEDTYHPHFHCMVFSSEYPQVDMYKTIKGAWSNKNQEFNYNSNLDIQIMKLWYMTYNKIRLSEKKYNEFSNDWFDLFMCDFREMNEKGIYEVLKYTFKDSDVKSYKVFKVFVDSLERKRIRQGYGILQGLKCEDVEEGEKLMLDDFLEKDKKENPEQVTVPGIDTLIKDYHEYRKISRFKAYDNLKNID